ncbi:phosphate ABC transporter permease subunit PstC [Desulfomicrobium escambiense]|uniref:phosphate ABC transporter permease subunit PstC n=1 Tax=Desulfomicrobium escambiense TaxID=29503 RepID=UPI00042594C8|nr:phosphate ABC transporter permease subunit PstC [Desulfomicrobium escambiense]
MTTTYLAQYLFAGLLPLALFGYLAGRRKIRAQQDPSARYKASENLFGWYAVTRMLLPAAVVSAGATILDLFDLIDVPWPMVAATALLLGAGAMWIGIKAIDPGLRVRTALEKTIVRVLLLASLISILTTIGIVLSIVFEAVHFFRIVNFWDFLTGTTWNPDGAIVGEGGTQHLFGSVPLFAGTFMITAIAMCVAIPVGLFSAICMSEYASLRVRRIAKPALEILAGIPTVVYGFFAAITVSPFIVRLAESVGLQADYTNALSPGLVMGIMIIPLVSSLSDDVISSVPQSLREGSLALGAYPSETIKRVVLPAALPGIVSACLLAISRAVGETMIVVMAAGLQPNLTWNPLAGMTTVNVRIVDALTGDQAFDSPETLAAFGLGLVLLVLTLCLNIVSLTVIRKFRQKYE